MYFLRGFTTTTLAACASAAAALACAKTSEFGKGSAGAPAAGVDDATGGSNGIGGGSGSAGGTVSTGGSTQSSTGGTSNSTPSGGTSSGGAPTSTCDEGQVLCGGTCVTESQLFCGPDCKRCAAGTSCVDSQCLCDDGIRVACDDTCIDVQADTNHCGRCDVACGALGVQCEAGVCACVEGAAACDGPCIDLTTTAEHCGACDTPCGANQSCVGGSCACSEGTEDCGSGCADIMSDAANCGACGTPCDEGLRCFEGACQTYPCFPFEEIAVSALVDQSLDTTDGACYRVELASSAAGNCWNFDGREMFINGEPVECGGSDAIGPQTAMADGYIYIEVTPGDYTYAGFGLW